MANITETVITSRFLTYYNIMRYTALRANSTSEILGTTKLTVKGNYERDSSIRLCGRPKTVIASGAKQSPRFGDCFGLDALAMTTVSNAILLIANS